ncbi:MAG TPA: condensation domain-containing protein, partial [Blastocatellia bacterium]|nr:condensation domain-containing protein [Blastocatellia bacterium]
AEVTAAELKRHLRERLPGYMVPEAIVMLNEMPVTANGKIDRRRLPGGETAGRQVAERLVAARTPVEEILVGIFKEVLKQEEVGVHDNFFEIGGHSLLATQLVSRLRNVFKIEIGVRSIFEENTAAGLARRVEAALGTGETETAPPLTRVSRTGPLPLSFAQQRLWFIEQLEPGNPVYNCPGALRLVGSLDLVTLERAINEIVRRHEILRTRIEVRDGQPRQVIDRWEPRRLEIQDLAALSPAEIVESAARLTQEEARAAFDLERGPWLRVKVLRLGEGEHVVLFTMHHIVSDGWSIGLLIKEIEAIYRAYRAGEESPLEELPIQYADFAVWQRNRLRGAILEQQLAYWRRQLGGELPVLELPTDRPRPAVPTYQGARLSRMLPVGLLGALKTFSAGQSCTLFMVLLAAFKTLLAHLTGQHDLAVGTDIANRNHAEVERLIGFFVNQLVLRTRLSVTSTFTELLHTVRETTLEAYAHQDLPFEKLVEALNPDRDASRTPLFQVKMVFQNTPLETWSLADLTLHPIEATTETAKFDLLLNLTDTPQGLDMSLQYSTDLFESATAARILSRFQTLLGQVVERPEARLEELMESLVGEERKEELDQKKRLEQAGLKRLKNIKRKAIGETRAEAEQ